MQGRAGPAEVRYLTAAKAPSWLLLEAFRATISGFGARDITDPDEAESWLRENEPAP